MHVIGLLTFVLSLSFFVLALRVDFGGVYALKIGKDRSGQVAHNASSNLL